MPRCFRLLRGWLLAALALLMAALASTRGNQIRAAALLGLNRNTLRKKIRELGVEVIKGLNESYVKEKPKK